MTLIPATNRDNEEATVAVRVKKSSVTKATLNYSTTSHRTRIPATIVSAHVWLLKCNVVQCSSWSVGQSVIWRVDHYCSIGQLVNYL